MTTPTPSDEQGTRVVVACALLLMAFVCLRRLGRKIVIIFDWDLTLDCISTPGSKQITREARDEILGKIGMTFGQEQQYMQVLNLFLRKMLVRCLDSNTQFLIVTRNDAENVRWMLHNVVKWASGRPPRSPLRATGRGNEHRVCSAGPPCLEMGGPGQPPEGQTYR